LKLDLLKKSSKREEQAELPFASSGDWRVVPNTKVRRPANGEPFSWTYTYTAFSLDFACVALERLDAKPSSLVFDPFLGSGTTAVAAAMRGCNSFGVDISPFSALLSRSRIATKVNPKRLAFYASARARSSSKESGLSDVINRYDYTYAKSVIDKMCTARKMSGSELWAKILNDQAGDFDSEAVMILSLALAAKETAKVKRGSNPIWYKRTGESDGHVDGEKLRAAGLRLSSSIANDILSEGSIKRREHRIKNVDFTVLNRAAKFDVCLTSPPYLNRLDYVIAHLPELSILQLLFPFSLELLRRSMIGTTKIVQKYYDPPPQDWGPACAEALAAVLHHKSYASAHYYYHTFFSYFDRLYASIKKLATLMRRRASGIIVVQDSFYKDVLIPTPQICAEMLRSQSCYAEVVKSTNVRVHMGRMSPNQNAYAPQKTLGEALVHFNNFN
jgi:hypothetical protein